MEVVEYTFSAAHKKCTSSIGKLLSLSMMAGAFLSMGATFSVIVGYGFPGATAANPVVQKLMMGAAFPLGLMLIIVLGVELFTSNCATLVPALITRKQTVGQAVRNLATVWCGNFLGSLFFAYLFVHLTGILHYEPWCDGLESIAVAKCSNPFFKTVLKGVAANWFVCLAVWMCYTAKSFGGKVLSLWLPVMAFVTLGYEHSIANMFFIPMAMMEGADITIGTLFLKNLIPATIGNILGGGLFVGGFFGLMNRPDHK